VEQKGQVLGVRAFSSSAYIVVVYRSVPVRRVQSHPDDKFVGIMFPLAVTWGVSYAMNDSGSNILR
jgi:hypothetical protein